MIDMRCLIALTVACIFASAAAANEGTPLVLTATLDDEAITPGTVRYLLRVMRERWRAVSRQPLNSGQTCDVEGRDGLTLFVAAKEE